MTPHRAPTLAAATQESIRSLFSAPVETTGAVGAGLVVLLGWAFGSANVALLWVVGLTMLLDLVVGSMHAVVDPLAQFDVHKLYGGFIGKLFRSLLIPTASLVDWLYIVSPLPLPEGYSTAFPVTSLVMVGLAAAELTSVLNHFRAGGVPLGPIAVIARGLDRMKLGEEPPARRQLDAIALAEEQGRKEGGES